MLIHGRTDRPFSTLRGARAFGLADALHQTSLAGLPFRPGHFEVPSYCPLQASRTDSLLREKKNALMLSVWQTRFIWSGAKIIAVRSFS